MMTKQVAFTATETNPASKACTWPTRPPAAEHPYNTQDTEPRSQIHDTIMLHSTGFITIQAPPPTQHTSGAIPKTPPGTSQTHGHRTWSDLTDRSVRLVYLSQYVS